MRFLIFLVVLFLFSFPARAESRYIIAIIDTGFDRNPALVPYECEGLSKDLTGGDGMDDYGHGSHVAYLATRGLPSKKFCFVMIKWLAGGRAPRVGVVAAGINYAVGVGAKVINLSLGGKGALDEEFEAILNALQQGVHVVVASGNEGANLSKRCDYYPACYPFENAFFHVVTSPRRSSNHGGTVTESYSGTCNYMGYKDEGTSYSAARATNRIAKGKHVGSH